MVGIPTPPLLQSPAMKLVENLRSLCASNVLQPMPLPKGVSLSSTGAISSRLKLRTEIDPNRALSYIYSTAHVFDQNVNEFQVYMPENFSGTVAEMDPSTVQLLMLWDRKHKIEHVSLMTHPILCNMSSVVHSVSEQYKKWGVVDAILEQDAAQGLAVSCWSDGPIELEVPEPVVSDCRLSFFLLEPWAFNDDDFQLFTKQTVMNNAPHRRGFVMRDFKDSDRLWGMIYDRCHRLHCRWFVVSTYDSWCFGVFSRGWTSAFVSSPKSGGSRSPTILQCLVYWILSSMDCEGKWDIDEVSPSAMGSKDKSKGKKRSSSRSSGDGEDESGSKPKRRKSATDLPSYICTVADFAFTNAEAARAVSNAR
ncbi:uncharacterized protein EI90DRAFT_3117524 [Cantharellus anzutake]|uniref:uncharacterized protein n=1 Tax=Cantharellus anzutake TaxID=1750568 RepID=UPI0019046F3C|nr:uncharacterized protein EI90DRAFT_3117524 [Cantharellus anzutake]KAF8339746.1 hypothetical protein EI90DRAFT_3117524 [Cantharellus anzutake]